MEEDDDDGVESCEVEEEEDDDNDDDVAPVGAGEISPPSSSPKLIRAGL